MPKKNIEESLKNLAKYALDILESNEEWNADIVESIAEYALDLKLAKLDNYSGMFKKNI
jgi:hypothetical protein